MIGYENLLNRVSEIAHSQTKNYPPCNIIKVDNSTLLLEMGVSGFKASEISVYTENDILYVSGEKKDSDNRNYIHRSLANRSFNWYRALSEDMRVENVTFEDGLLTIKLARVVPEEKLKKVWF